MIAWYWLAGGWEMFGDSTIEADWVTENDASHLGQTRPPHQNQLNFMFGFSNRMGQNPSTYLKSFLNPIWCVLVLARGRTEILQARTLWVLTRSSQPQLVAYGVHTISTSN